MRISSFQKSLVVMVTMNFISFVAAGSASAVLRYLPHANEIHIESYLGQDTFTRWRFEINLGKCQPKGKIFELSKAVRESSQPQEFGALRVELEALVNQAKASPGIKLYLDTEDKLHPLKIVPVLSELEQLKEIQTAVMVIAKQEGTPIWYPVSNLRRQLSFQIELANIRSQAANSHFKSVLSVLAYLSQINTVLYKGVPSFKEALEKALEMIEQVTKGVPPSQQQSDYQQQSDTGSTREWDEASEARTVLDTAPVDAEEAMKEGQCPKPNIGSAAPAGVLLNLRGPETESVATERSDTTSDTRPLITFTAGLRKRH